MPNPAAYIYSPLSDDREHIRLLTLLPSRQRDAPLHGSLTVKPLNSFLPRYEALSYTWGTDISPEDLLLDGNALTIALHLRDALRRLRHRYCTRRVWIDAVCINQAYGREKTAQIAIMRVIYAKAERTIVWLGEDTLDGEAEIAMQVFTMVNTRLKYKHYTQVLSDALARFRNVKYDLMRCLPTSLRPTRPRMSEFTALLRTTRWGERHTFEAEELTEILERLKENGIEDKIVPFLCRRWFSRRWVIQEICLSRRAVLLCGQWTLDWKVFESALNDIGKTPLFTKADQTAYRLTVTSSLFRGPTENRFIGARLDDWADGSTLFENCARDLLFELDTLGQFQCADPRDIISALVGLWSPFSGVAFIDYDLTTEQNYSLFALRMIDLGLAVKLLYAAVQRPDSDPAQVRSLPSWIPDWRNPMLSSQTQPQLIGQSIRTAMPSKAQSMGIVRVARDRSTIYLKAVILDIISGWHNKNGPRRDRDGWAISRVVTQLGGSGEVLNLTGTSVAASREDVAHLQWKFPNHLVQPGDIICAIADSRPFTEALIMPYYPKEPVKSLTMGLFVIRAKHSSREEGAHSQCYTLISILTSFTPGNTEAVRRVFLNEEYEDLMIV
ncbi:hypothetical protein CKM354_000015600 [Cercospora kikuchii]|uniref:Heterokaryon incompatibility domain-containing protein n=1 Tax=Cercospora kikuchii TaxID=84275 RepID=A0A9P3CDD0_9PEZI|nr:uncharacterized protein CKM354_000015600 [Cercospora kikuchii]GIZ36688.1 hypothetical protein CKM354_000015600 [Cercospora kikuchii]